jgi:ABC-type Fe3+ transport system permease subunit
MSLLRSLMVGGVAVAIARFLCALLADRRAPARRIAWVLLLAPYFTPVMLTGYAYANFSLSLIHHPWVNAVFYAALLCWKFTPIAAVILYFAPPPISAEAIHCRRLMDFQRQQSVATTRAYSTPDTKFNEWKFLFHAGCARGPVAAFAVVFLCAFAEFEMASLMGVKSWTVTVFDANAGGLAVTESLRRMLGPLLCEIAAVATTVAVLGRHRLNPVRRSAAGKTTHGIAWLYLSIAFVFVLMIPAGMVLWGTIRGFGLLFENFVLTREIVSSLLFAAGATLLASAAILWLSPAPWIRRKGTMLRRALLLIGVCLGLLGPLVLSLAVLAAVQLPGLLSLRDTPVPLVLTLALVLLPLALVLKRVLELTGYRSALHLANLMPSSRASQELKWQLNASGKFWAVVLLFVWVYWDLTTSSILAPIGMTPVTVRLYNMMHYGQIAALSAMTCATFAVPIFIFLLAFGTRRWWAPR